MKTVGNGRENPLTVPATVFFGRERKRERKNRTGKRNRYYGISGMEYSDRKHTDYGRESENRNGNTTYMGASNISQMTMMLVNRSKFSYINWLVKNIYKRKNTS